jgi:hypothetical protein
MAELEGKTQDERVAALVSAVGGPVRAAALIGKTRTHVDNMRKAGAPLRLEDVLVLAREAGVTLDWVATGETVRADLRGLAAPDAGSFDALPGFVRLLPLRPDVLTAGGRTVERWTPSEFAVSTHWLDRLGLTEETARYALSGDAGMAPAIGKGAFLVLDGRRAASRTGLYLVAVGEELLPRRLHRLPDGTSELIADADPRWRFVVGEAVEMYRIVWVGQGM